MSHGWQAQRAVSLLDSHDLRNSSPRDKDTNANTLATLTLGTGEYLRMHMDIVPARRLETELTYNSDVVWERRS